jgi:hypothetical protein
MKRKKLSHKKKLSLARRMMTSEERSNHTPPFLSKAWGMRKESNMAKPKKKGKQSKKK